MAHVRNKNHLFTGLFLIAVAMIAFHLAAPLSHRTEVGLGPGFVPRMFASLQTMLGLALVVSGFVTTDESHERWRLRPLLVLASIAFFCVAIERLGLVIALIGLVLIACAANRETRLREAVALAIGAAAFSSVLFVKLLGLSIPLWPTILPGV